MYVCLYVCTICRCIYEVCCDIFTTQIWNQVTELDSCRTLVSRNSKQVVLMQSAVNKELFYFSGLSF